MRSLFSITVLTLVGFFITSCNESSESNPKEANAEIEAVENSSGTEPLKFDLPEVNGKEPEGVPIEQVPSTPEKIDLTGIDLESVEGPPKAAPDETLKLEVTIQTNDLRVIEDKGEVIWEPDRSVKSASYKTYIFPLENFQEKLGHPKDLKGEYKMKIQGKRVKSETYIPDDPSLPRPSGGFGLITFSAKILERLP